MSYFVLQKTFCESKILFNNNKLDLKADLCRTSKGDLNLQMEHLNNSHIPNWSAFSAAFYSNSTVKQTYQIALLPRMMNGKRLIEIAKTIKLYLDCFENPYVTGCRIHGSSCKPRRHNNTGSDNTTDFSNIQIDIEESMDNLKLQCIQGTKERPQRVRRSVNGILNCCPRDENIICHGCKQIPNGKTHVKVSFCPKGFICLGKIPVGGNKGQSSPKMQSERFINIIYTTRKLLYRYRRTTEMTNKVDELQALYHLKIIHKALQVIVNDFAKFV